MTKKNSKTRLDDLLVELGYFPDTDTALRAVLAREVRVNDVYATSAALMVAPDADIFIKTKTHGQNADSHRYVSRGGFKLQAALDAFNQSVTGLRCIDIGSSTGGFTDCLLQAGAASVTCVDVNYGQLAWSLRQDERVIVFERTNIKTADAGELGAPFDLIVADVSFIGLASLAPAFARLSDEGTVFIGLVKPQFESQHDETDHGVVRDPAIRARTVTEVSEALEANGFTVTDVTQSPITGPKGNVEFLVRGIMTTHTTA
ncbi:MAG: TlyA family RNA methyltransferase [Eggerthellaceae bacterium]|nr:TlyA family RNA methyltransferase [Eggerthellaceae bacterium]